MISFRDIDDLRFSDPALLEYSAARLNAFHAEAGKIALALSREVGWRGKVPLSFEGFDGCHVERTADTVSLYEAGEVLMEVSITSRGTVELKGSLPELEGMTDARICRMMREVILSPENVQEAREFCSYGRFRVRGFSSPDMGQEWFVSRPDVPGLDEGIRSFCVDAFGREPNLVSQEAYDGVVKALRSFPKAGESPRVSVRPESPVFIDLEFDGRTVDDFSDFYTMVGTPERAQAYSENKEALATICHELNGELISRSHLTEDSDRERLYHFPNARYILSSSEDAGIRVVSGCGTQVHLYAYPTDSAEDSRRFRILDSLQSEPREVSIEELYGEVSSRVLSVENIRRMDDDFRISGMSVRNPERREPSLPSGKAESQGQVSQIKW